MWGLRSLIEFGPQLHATQEFLTEIYPFLANGTHGREFFTKLYPLLPNDILGWALRMGFLVIAVCAYYLTGNGLPTSTVTS